MDVGTVIGKILTDDEREWFEIPVGLCLDDVSFTDLAEEAKKQGVVNQLGVQVDITLLYVINQGHPRYEQLRQLRQELNAAKVNGPLRPIHPADHPVIVELNKKRTPDFVKHWGFVYVPDTDKYKQVFEQENETRQAGTGSYSRRD